MVRARYVDLFRRIYGDDDLMLSLAEKDFDEIAGEGQDRVNPDELLRDRAMLGDVSVKLKKYADKHLAHMDSSPLVKIPTYADLNHALDVIGELLIRYTRIVTGASKQGVEPTIQEDWKSIFEVAWLEPRPNS